MVLLAISYITSAVRNVNKMKKVFSSVIRLVKLNYPLKVSRGNMSKLINELRRILWTVSKISLIMKYMNRKDIIPMLKSVIGKKNMPKSPYLGLNMCLYLAMFSRLP